MSDEIETREVRARFVSHHAEGARAHKEHSRQVFNAWYTTELRKARAEALREAADLLDAEDDPALTRPALSEAVRQIEWLRDRADQIEEKL